MGRFIVNGGKGLYGGVRVSGSKNAALPVLFSTLIIKGVSLIRNVPDILDVRAAITILESYGARIVRRGDTLSVDTRLCRYHEPDREIVSRLRASTYLIGASLARFGKCCLGDFGGCAFTKRPIDLHILAAQSFGARYFGDRLECSGLSPAKIVFPIRSVGATANALILASSIQGESTIRCYAKEPHILCLIDFLRSAGAKITLTDTHITVVGGTLSGGECSIIGDMIEAGTYLAAGVVTGGKVGVIGVSSSDMSAFLDAISDMGADVAVTGDVIYASRSQNSYRASVCAEPYPAYPTDLQPIAAPLLASFSGGEIYDKVFPERFGYLEQLSHFGLSSHLVCGGAYIEKSHFTHAVAEATDLRAGAACLLCALCADGESQILSADTILRGYESPVEKLSALGAHVSSLL